MQEQDQILRKKEISGAELEFLLEQRKVKEANFLLVDVREVWEFENKKIIGVDHLIPMSDFFKQVSKIDNYKSTPIITQCKVGGRSAQAQRQLSLMGFKTVINLAGGIADYKGKIE